MFKSFNFILSPIPRLITYIYRRIVRSLHSSIYREKAKCPIPNMHPDVFLRSVPKKCRWFVHADKECGYHKGASICRGKKKKGKKREVVFSLPALFLSHLFLFLFLFLSICSNPYKNIATAPPMTAYPRPKLRTSAAPLCNPGRPVPAAVAELPVCSAGSTNV